MATKLCEIINDQQTTDNKKSKTNACNHTTRIIISKQREYRKKQWQ